MSARWGGVLLASLVASAGVVRAQPPAVPGAPALPGGPVPAAAGVTGAATTPAAGAAAPKNIWSFLMKTPEQKAQFKAHFCRSRAGMFINNMLVPVGAATGGLLGPICPPPGTTPNPDDLKKSPTSAEGAAAKIKAEEAGAKAKVAALEYLGTVDCRYYPEAEAGLITGLRAEKNECVRIAAAKALASGCCCSPRVVKALLISVNCTNKDGFPAEASELVRTYAFVALERCLRKCVTEEPETPPEPPAAVKKATYDVLSPVGAAVDYSSSVLLAAYYPLEARETNAQVLAEARAVLGRGLKVSPQTIARLSGPKNLRDGVFPADGRAPISLSSIGALSLPSFAAIRRSRTVTSEPTADLAPVAPPAGKDAVAAAAPTAETRTGRGSLAHIFQDSWKR